MSIELLWIILLTFFLFEFSPIWAHDCGSKFVAAFTEQTLTSPDYPDDFAQEVGEECVYNIINYNPEDVIVYKFNDFAMPTNLDTLHVTAEKKRIIYRIGDHIFSKDSKIEGEFVIPDRQISMTAKAGSNLSKGRKFSITFVLEPINLRAEFHTATSTWSQMTSPNYPNQYPLNTVKLYVIKAADPHYHIKFKLDKCRFNDTLDSLKVFSGNIINHRKILMNHICWPEEFVSDDSEVLAALNSGHPTGAVGFVLKFMMFDPNEKNQVTTSTNSPTTKISEKLQNIASCKENNSFLYIVLIYLIILIVNDHF